jgi:acyl-ACP thioesterase
MRLSELFSVLQELSIADVEKAGITRDRTLDRGLLWVISRMKLLFERPIQYDEEVTFTTWPGKRIHMVFPRYYEARDSEGNLLLQGSALWLLIDAQRRIFISPQDYDIEIPPAEKEGIELPMALRRISQDRPAVIRTALYSDIDLNGHVNNTRYLDWMDDLFDMHFHDVYTVSALQINYEHEVTCGQSVSLCYEYEDQVYRIEGKTKDANAFHARMDVKRL